MSESHLKHSLLQQQPRAVCFKRKPKEQVRTLSISCTVVPLFCLSCFPRINVHFFSIAVSMVHQGCVHTQQGAWVVLSQSVFPSLPVSVSLCLTLKPCLLTLIVKTGLYFSFLERAGLEQVVKRSKLSSFHNINTLFANNNYSTWGVFPLIC